MEKILVDWTSNYIKNKDIMQKTLVDLEIKENHILCKHKNGQVTKYIVNPRLTQDAFSEIKDGQNVIVCLNTRQNIDFVINNWQKLISYKRLSIIFANPSINERWIIFPHTHNLISEKGAIKKGLLALFSSVEEVNV